MKDVKIKLEADETDIICEKCGRKMVVKYGKKELSVLGSVCSVIACGIMLLAPITPDGKGIIVESNIFTGMLKVRNNDMPELLPKAYHKDEVKVLAFKPKNNTDTTKNDENE